MHVVGTFFFRLITILFFVGMAGSAIVVFMAFVEDFRDLFGSDDTPEPEHAPPSAARPSPARGYPQQRRQLS